MTNPLSHDEQVLAIKTWRYLRLAMIVLVVGLGVAILFEHSKTKPHCFQTSISAYYYTPAQGVFVGALVAVGVCLVCLKGNTDTEDILLNLAGMFAPVVAFVPTPGTGSCASVLGTAKDRDVNVGNNVYALLALGLIALLILAVLVVKGVTSGDGAPTVPSMIGYGVATAVWLAALLVFWLSRPFFVRNAHYTAAILMFVCILLVAILNATSFKQKTEADSIRNRYSAIAAAMVLAAVVIGVAGALGWDYWVLAIEFALVTLFATFWLVQTRELWHDGLR